MSESKEKHQSALPQLLQFIQGKSTSVLSNQKHILEIDADHTDTLHAFQEILDKGYLSAPAYHLDKHTHKKHYIGFIDTRNLVAWAVFAYDERNVTPSLSEIIHHGIKRVDVAMDAVTVSYLARSNPMHPVTSNSDLCTALKRLSARGCHRIPVLNAEGDVEKLITQYGIIEFLYKNRAHYPEDLKKTIGELNIGHSPVVSVANTTPTIEVFQKMEKNNLSGIAVLNDEGKIIGATSGADLKLFLQYTVRASLDLTIMQFLNIIRQESLRATVPVLVCESSGTLESVIAKLAATREHRIFVIDSNKSFKPIKVISLSDILSAVIADEAS